MNTCRLDTLPAELVHHLLGYFSVHEIFHTFTNVTSYIDAVLAAYTNYQVNFIAITRPNFDLVCQHMRPDQVVALTLSNDEDTPGLIGLFLSRFQINQFTRLQSLRLIDIGEDFWESIIIPMTTLKYLRSFCFFSPDRNERWVCNLSGDSVTELDRSLFDIYAPILPQLHQLVLCHGDFLHSIQFPHLRHLVLDRSTVDLMKHISVAAPQLQSLNTRFSLDALPTELIYPMTQLSCLVLTIEEFGISMNVFERMISNLPRLKHLELIASCDDDVVDGQRWQTKAENLVIFKFNLQVSAELESQQLDSFRTSFWVEQKQWFVAYTDGQFFSVPHFIRTKCEGIIRLPQYTTVPDKGIFYQCINYLQLTEESSYINHHFRQVRTLALYSAPSLSTIKKIVDLRQIHNLTVVSLEENFPVASLINAMPNLCRIWIKNNVGNFLSQVCYKAPEKIRTLELSDILMDTDDHDTEHLSMVFPNIKHLTVKSRCSIKQILDFLSRFKHLSTASFRYLSWPHRADARHIRLNIQSTFDRTRCMLELNYTHRFDHSMVYFWI